jgi:ATP-binding cassette subfamily G (WHITE) protein 2 (PDR)
MFDQLLLIDAGETVYFGPIGEQCKSMIRYFEDHGAPPHQKDDNPSEWMFRVTSRDSARTWPETWESSDERYCMQEELSNLREQKLDREIEPSRFSSEYASSFWTQFKALTYRTMTDCWRTPAYLWGKLAFYFLVVSPVSAMADLAYVLQSLIIGFSFWNTPNSLQGLQNQLFSVFLVITTFSCAMQQVVPDFIRRRDLFETRERPSRIYSWQAFLISTTITEILWQTVIAILVFPVWYYPTGMYRNSFGYERHERGLLMFLLTWSFFIFTSTLSYLVASAIEIEETAVNIAQLLFYLVLLFCG